MGALELVNVEVLVNLRDVIDDNIGMASIIIIIHLIDFFFFLKGVAWGVDVKIPLTISLAFSFYYIDAPTPPKLEILQIRDNIKDKTFKLRSQLTCV